MASRVTRSRSKVQEDSALRREWVCRKCTWRNLFLLEDCEMCQCPRAPATAETSDSEIEILYVKLDDKDKNTGNPKRDYDKAGRKHPLEDRVGKLRLENKENRKPVQPRTEAAAASNSAIRDVEHKQNPDFWSCPTCTLLNPMRSPACQACSTTNPNPSQRSHERVNRRKSNDPRAPVGKGLKETLETIAETCAAVGEKFVDDSFPPGPKALFINGSQQTIGAVMQGDMSTFIVPAQWLRPHEILCEGNERTKWSVMRDPQPSDICQGSLGDCWVMGSIALIAERKDLLDQIIQTKEINEYGAYVIRLNYNGKWQDVIVDDLLPCDKYKRLLYAKGKRKQLWVPLIEKALAKLNGSYEALCGGWSVESLTNLTGFPCSSIYLTSEHLDIDMTWATLVSSAAAGFMISTATHCSDPIKMVENEKMGLQSQHAYSVMEVNGEWGHKLMKLRNPWGKSHWRGNWNPRCPKWTAAMKTVFRPQNSRGQEGVFWMSFEDFVKHFCVIDICRIRTEWFHNSFRGLFLPYADQDNHPCYSLRLEKSTELDIVLYNSSWVRRMGTGLSSNSAIPDISFMVFKSESGEKDVKQWKLVRSSKRRKSRSVNLEIMLDPGTYFLVPMSFSLWTEDDSNECFPEFEFTLHSSKDVKCERVLPPPFLLADCIPLLMTPADGRRMGNIKSYFNKSGGFGIYVFVENHDATSHVGVETDFSGSMNLAGVRGHRTWDIIPPMSRQVINVLTAETNGDFEVITKMKSYIVDARRHNSSHCPPIGPRNMALHSVRPI